MIKIVDSNVFNIEADAIVNTINCVGFMGKGLAYEYSLRYPNLLLDYKEKCKKNEIKPGKMYYYKEKDKIIVNFPTKNDYKYPSKIEWIKDGIKDFINTYKDYNIKSIAFPLLGCKNGGLDYREVIDIMQKGLSNLDIDIYICLDKINPEGKELEMINCFNSCDIETLSNFVKLNNSQKDSLRMSQKKIKRFFQISKIEGIGSKTYKDIYQVFYNNKYKDNFVQQSLF